MTTATAAYPVTESDVSSVEGWRPADAIERRVSRARLHRYVRETSPRMGAKDCLVAPRDGAGVRVRVSGDTGRAHVSGLKRCGSPWACPVCTPNVRHRRATELVELVENARSEGCTVLLATATIPHRSTDSLAELVGDLGASWSKFWSGRAARDFRDRWAMAGSVRAIEVTWGQRSGWHPHVHALLVFDGVVSPAELVTMWAPLIVRWQDTVEEVTGRRPDSLACFDLREVDDPGNVSSYVVDEHGWSVGAELAAGPAKLGRVAGRWSPLALLGAAALWGDADAAKLWREYESATTGRRAIVASAGLYERFEIGQATDDEAAEGPEAENVVAEIVVDVMVWCALAAVDATDRYLIVVEAWAASGCRGDPPDPGEFVRCVLVGRRT